MCYTYLSIPQQGLLASSVTKRQRDCDCSLCPLGRAPIGFQSPCQPEEVQRHSALRSPYIHACCPDWTHRLPVSPLLSWCQQFAYFKPTTERSIGVGRGGGLKDNLTHLSLNCTTAERSLRTKDLKSCVHPCGLLGPKEGEPTICLESARRKDSVTTLRTVHPGMPRTRGWPSLPQTDRVLGASTEMPDNMAAQSELEVWSVVG